MVRVAQKFTTHFYGEDDSQTCLKQAIKGEMKTVCSRQVSLALFRFKLHCKSTSGYEILAS